ncbi:hypothetical protein [Paludibacterium paludis]|uniref:Uncharacterized protein n=1 Tax=Paludibacterium paludis TaxID=1225769 RepID=A0A918U9N5_9NEIS|nr:hypothetical protein [Paludibacterium paludis]GGY16793.1 hypothetical protein GCM10011289_20270 [Paludibacterium paludis]
MMTFLGARLDRRAQVLVNVRLDGYPSYFHIEPGAVAAFLGEAAMDPAAEARLVGERWAIFAAPLETLVRRHGQDFRVTGAMLDALR